MKKVFVVVLFFVCCGGTVCYAQKGLIDSLEKRVANGIADTNKLKDLGLLCMELNKKGEVKRGLEAGNGAILLGKQLVSRNENAAVMKAARHGLAVGYVNTGILYYRQDEFNKSLEYYLSAMKIGEQIGDKVVLGTVYNWMGLLYLAQRNEAKALENFNTSLKIREEIGDRKGLAQVKNNLGLLYQKKNNYEKALESYSSALKDNEALGNQIGAGASNCNIGNVYYFKQEYAKALEYYISSAAIRKEAGDRYGLAISYVCISNLYMVQNKMMEAKHYSVAALTLAKELGSKSNLKLAYQMLSKCDSASGNWKSAYENTRYWMVYNDSIYNEENAKKIAEMGAKYENGKKEGQIQLLEKEKEKQAAVTAEESKRQNTVLLFVVLGLAVVLVFSVFMFNRWRVTKQQKLVIEKQKDLMEDKNKEITKSIEYALKIQSAILPPIRTIKRKLEKSFVMYKPKDIVAGDFYWMEVLNLKEEDEVILLAACDCTGHGVPGAMVSVVCHNALNRAVREFGLIQPAAILDKTAEIVIENFSKSEETIKDGMDISMVSFRYNKENKTAEIEYAGANNPLWIVRNGVVLEGLEGTSILEETKADKQPIGMNENKLPFRNHHFTLNEGDSVYLFTDGFADQFGGDKGEKKLTKKRFKNLIVSIQDKTLQEQGFMLDRFITNYRKDVEQIDDILVMGVSV